MFLRKPFGFRRNTLDLVVIVRVAAIGIVLLILILHAVLRICLILAVVVLLLILILVLVLVFVVHHGSSFPKLADSVPRRVRFMHGKGSYDGFFC